MCNKNFFTFISGIDELYVSEDIEDEEYIDDNIPLNDEEAEIIYNLLD